MNKIFFTHLRDIAIGYLPDVQKFLEQAKTCPVDDEMDTESFSMGLFCIADKTFARPEATVIELAAAQLLVGLMGLELYNPNLPKLRDTDPVPKDRRESSLRGIANAVKTLANVTGRADIQFVDPLVHADTQSAAKVATVAASEEAKPWLIADPRDPDPEYPWYTPARYFARQIIKADSTLLTKRNILANKVVRMLTNAGINKRGGKKPFEPSTVLKALSGISLG